MTHQQHQIQSLNNPNNSTSFLQHSILYFFFLNSGDIELHCKNLKKCFNIILANSCYPELGKCGFFPAYRDVQTNFYRYNFMVHCHL